jgi:hypothetical protein
MKTQNPAPAAQSLQNKLDHIARDRDVLALQRELALDGLREGDDVRHVDAGTLARVVIARGEDPPRVVVMRRDGAFEAFSRTVWCKP